MDACHREAQPVVAWPADTAAGTDDVASDALPMEPHGDRARFFATEWLTTSQTLNRMLAARGVGHVDREDIVQETAMRLFVAWHRLDPSRGASAYAAVIALNVLRDEIRCASRRRELAIEPPDVATPLDRVETLALVRVEVRRVARAIRQLTPREQGVLTDAATDDPTQRTPVSPATRMARMRARRRLLAALDTPVDATRRRVVERASVASVGRS